MNMQERSDWKCAATRTTPRRRGRCPDAGRDLPDEFGIARCPIGESESFFRCVGGRCGVCQRDHRVGLLDREMAEGPRRDGFNLGNGFDAVEQVLPAEIDRLSLLGLIEQTSKLRFCLGNCKSLDHAHKWAEKRPISKPHFELQTNFNLRAANRTILRSSHPCRQRWMFVDPYVRSL